MGELPGRILDTPLACGYLYRIGSSHHFELDRPATLEAHATTLDGGTYSSTLIWLEPPCTPVELACGSPSLSTSVLVPGTYRVRVGAAAAGPFRMELLLTDEGDGG